jgi:uncharacterized protein
MVGVAAIARVRSLPLASFKRLVTLKIVAVSDLHGLKARFDLLGRLFDGGIDTLLIAGDIAASGDPQAQQDDVRRHFGSLLHGRSGIRILAIPGNDDWKIVEATLKEFPEITVPTGQACPLAAGVSVVGYPYVPISPFLMKDFEKWDGEDEPALPSHPEQLEEALIAERVNIHGIRSRGLDLEDHTFDPRDRRDNIRNDLEKAARLSDPRETLFLMHCPPFGFMDDGISVGHEVHIGSKAVRTFIHERQPLLTVHGHSHEAVDRAGGQFAFSIAQSTGLSVGPGNNPKVLNYLLLDLETRLFLRRRLSV